MTLKSLKLILLLSILTIVSSCTGPDKAKTSSNFESTGKVVSALDTQIWAIYQDQKENYWFGSNGNGVFHYDGEELVQYTQNNGLADNTIRGIQGDHLGNVFIETPAGISKYNGSVFTTLQPIIADSNKWQLTPTDLWFNCNGMPDDVYRYDGDALYELKLPRQNLIEAFGMRVQGLGFPGMNSSPYSVFGIDKDKAGNLWIGTVVAGAFRYDGTSFLWFSDKELSTLPDGRVPGVRSILEDKNGHFWLSNFISKYRIYEKDSIVQHEKLEGIALTEGPFQDRIPYFNSGLADNNGDLWMTTYTGGVWKYDGEQLLNFPVTDGETEVLLISIYKDRNGVLWLGTDNAGAYRFNGESFDKFEPIRNEGSR